MSSGHNHLTWLQTPRRWPAWSKWSAWSRSFCLLACWPKVNYTRKINHFAIFFIPVFVDQQFASETFTDVVYLSVSALGTLGFLVIFLERVRSKVPVFQLMFEGFDRPEDRPHTLLWLWTQYAAGFAVMVPMIWWFGHLGYEALVTIPILINIVGDG